MFSRSRNRQPKPNLGGGRLLTAAALCALLGLPARADMLHDGIQALQQGQYEQAEHLLREAARLKPQDPVPVEWLTKLFEQTMEPAALNAALTELNRRRDAMRRAHARLPAKPTAKPARPARIQLDGATMPRHGDDLVDLGPLPSLPPDPLTLANGPDAPPVQTPAWKQWRLQKLHASLSALQATLQQLRERFGAYGQAPAKVQTMTQELEHKVANHQKAMKQLQSELGD